jgi:ribosome-associated protein
MELSLLTKLIKDELEELQGFDLVELDVTDKTSIADLLMVVSAKNPRHLKSIASKLVEKLKHHDQQPLSVSGLDNGDWALVDCGDIIVHVMRPEIRAYYNLEGLWSFSEPSESHREN